MAYTQADLDAAQERANQAQLALNAAIAHQTQINSDPTTKAMDSGSADTAVRNANTALNREINSYKSVKADLDKQKAAATPRPPTLTEVEKQTQRDKNFPVTGHRETDQEMDTRMGRDAAIAQRAQSSANTAASSAARTNETATHNAETETTARIQAQIDALNKAGILARETDKQVGDQAEGRVTSAINVNRVGNEAGNNLLTNETALRGQDITVQNARSKFIGDIMTTAMPQVAQMMMKLPKGSNAASNFLKAFLVMANMAYSNSGLDKDIPRPDMNSPEMLAMKQRARIYREIPPMLTSAQQGWETTIRMAVLGYPPSGYNGPIGTKALDLLGADPDTIKQMGGRPDDKSLIDSLKDTPEGKAIVDEATAPVQALIDKHNKGETLTPEEEASVLRAANMAKDALVKKAQSNLTNKIQAESDPTYKFKQTLRDTLTGENSDQKVNMMSSAIMGQQNKAEGKPLTADQQILIDNLDPEDIQLIQSNLTPDARDILARQARGEKVSDIELKFALSKINGISALIKARPQAPPQPKPVVAAVQAPPTTPAPPTTADIVKPPLPTPLLGPAPKETDTASSADRQISPEAIQSAQADVRSEEAKLVGVSPDDRAMYTKIKAEQRQAGNAAYQEGTQINFQSDILDQARQRVLAGERADQQYYDTPISKKSPNGIPDFTGMFSQTSKSQDDSPTNLMSALSAPTEDTYTKDMPKYLNPSMFNMGNDPTEQEDPNPVDEDNNPYQQLIAAAPPPLFNANPWG